MERQYDLVIVGAGPAGLSAALYGSRAGLKTLILENGAPGGKLIKTNKISNYPGIKDIEGTQLAMDMFEQATSFQAEYAYGEVNKIDESRFHEEDLIGRVYEYFLQVYAASGTKEDGEFYTPACIVQLIAEIIEPYSGVVYDKTTPRLIQFHTLKNAVNPPLLGGFLFSSTVAA